MGGVKNSQADKVVNNQFVYAGRLEFNKGILSLIEMWKQLPENYTLHIYGSGTLEKRVRKEINGVKNISFMGFKPQEDVFEDYKRSIAVIIPSEWYETFGMGIPECFSMKVPVVCTDIGNPGEMVKEAQGGSVYPVGDFCKFKDALSDVVLNRVEYSDKAYQYYQNNLSDKENYRELMEIYDKSRVIN